jgi:hypothetical protein
MTITVDDLLRMTLDDLHGVVAAARPLDPDALADSQYQGIDLGMPALFHKLMWRTFRKTFHRDPRTGAIRGWNVRMQQRGVDGPQAPMTDARGAPRTFGHYVLRPAGDERFPRGVRCPWALDYDVPENAWWDPARLGLCPLVAVNDGSNDLLLGWEVFRPGPLWLPLPDHWILRREGPLDPMPIPQASSR